MSWPGPPILTRIWYRSMKPQATTHAPARCTPSRTPAVWRHRVPRPRPAAKGAQEEKGMVTRGGRLAQEDHHLRAALLRLGQRRGRRGALRPRMQPLQRAAVAGSSTIESMDGHTVGCRALVVFSGRANFGALDHAASTAKLGRSRASVRKKWLVLRRQQVIAPSATPPPGCHPAH